jgi:hypothetical protein
MPNKGSRGEITLQFFLVGDFDNESDIFPFIILSSESLSLVCCNLGPDQLIIMKLQTRASGGWSAVRSDPRATRRWWSC